MMAAGPAILLITAVNGRYPRVGFEYKCIGLGSGLLAFFLAVVTLEFLQPYLLEQHTIISRQSFWLQWLYSAGLPEELAKVFLFWAIIRQTEEGKEADTALLGGILLGIGFAVPESACFIVSNEQYMHVVAFARAATALPHHAIWGLMLAFLFCEISKARRPSAKFLFVFALLLPISLHTAWDATVDILIHFEEKSLTGDVLFPAGTSAIINAVGIILYRRYCHATAVSSCKTMKQWRRFFSWLGWAMLLLPLGIIVFFASLIFRHIPISKLDLALGLSAIPGLVFLALTLIWSCHPIYHHKKL